MLSVLRYMDSDSLVSSNSSDNDITGKLPILALKNNHALTPSLAFQNYLYNSVISLNCKTEPSLKARNRN